MSLIYVYFYINRYKTDIIDRYNRYNKIKYIMIKFHDFDIKMLQASFFPKENL